MTKKLILVSMVLIMGLFSATGAQAQDGTPYVPSDDEVNAIAKNLYCPVCPNTPLDVCETQACKDWRDQIRDQLAAGWSEDEIIDYFITQYGERVLAEPQRQGFSSLVWVLPVLIVAAGGGILWQVLDSWKNRQPDKMPPPSAHDIDPEVLAKIEKEIRSID